MHERNRKRLGPSSGILLVIAIVICAQVTGRSVDMMSCLTARDTVWLMDSPYSQSILYLLA
jgi:hypothetical protein